MKTNELRFNIMKSLLKQLWFQSNNCSEPIQNMGFQIFEVSKFTGSSRKDILRHFFLLVDENYITRISEEPLLYEFTEKGKKIKTYSEIKNLIKNKYASKYLKNQVRLKITNIFFGIICFLGTIVLTLKWFSDLYCIRCNHYSGIWILTYFILTGLLWIFTLKLIKNIN